VRSHSFFAGCIFAFGLVVGTAQAQSTTDLVGTWTLVSVSGDPDGPNPKGILMFDAAGRFAQQIVRSDVPKYATAARSQATAEEYKPTALGSLAFFGTYSVSGTELTRNIETSSWPNQTGTVQKLSNLTVADASQRWCSDRRQLEASKVEGRRPSSEGQAEL
jgi:hypothetical protein